MNAAVAQERDPLCVRDFEGLARRRLSRPVWDFLAGGSGTESTIEANRAVLDRIRLRPRVLAGVTGCSTETTLLGRPMSAPLGVAPMAHHRLFHPEGEVATAQAAGTAGVLFIASMFANRTLEAIAGASPAPPWLQLYWLRERAEMERLIARAESAGFGALVLTVDAPVVARRLRDIRNGFAIPDDVRAVNLSESVMAATHRAEPGWSAIEQHAAQQFKQDLGWADLSWLRRRTELPVILKGVLTAPDAQLAVDHGVDGLIVSNHGGRQLDGAIPALSALPEIAAVTHNRCALLIDGSFRHGSDVLKALALGADTVLIGRPVLWGLGYAGSAGVAAVLDLLRRELAEAMMLTGRPGLTSVDDTLVSWGLSAFGDQRAPYT
jgi:4-hydroxymandelate oxidase